MNQANSAFRYKKKSYHITHLVGLILLSFIFNFDLSAWQIPTVAAQTSANTPSYDLIIVIDGSGSIYGDKGTDPGKKDDLQKNFLPHTGNRIIAAQTLTRLLGRTDKSGVTRINYIFFSSELRIIAQDAQVVPVS